LGPASCLDAFSTYQFLT